MTPPRRGNNYFVIFSTLALVNMPYLAAKIICTIYSKSDQSGSLKQKGFLFQLTGDWTDRLQDFGADLEIVLLPFKSHLKG